MEWLCGFTFVLVALAAIGHALWWIGATLLRSIFGAAPPDSVLPRPFHHCPACGKEIIDREIACTTCGLDFDGKLAWKLARVRAAQAEVRQLLESGELDLSTAEKVIDKLKRRGRLMQGLPADPVRARPVLPKEEAEVARPSLEALPAEETKAEEPLPAAVPTRVPRARPVAPPPVPRLKPVAVVPEATPPVTTDERSTSLPPTHEEPRSSVIAAFMEERNILWGELVGGLLIVGCSIALVVTLWHSLETIPYFPFLLSAAITLALYGAGQYTLHHWKLTSTSRGLLVIALLLTPLNLLLLSDAVTRGEVSAIIDGSVKLAAIGLFAWVVRGGGRDILTARPEWRWWLALAMVGAPAMQLMPASWSPSQGIDLSAWLSLGCFALGSIFVLRDRSLRGIPGEPEAILPSAANAMLAFLALAAFGLAAAWGLHIAQSLDAAEQIAGLALPLALAAVPVVEAGLLIQQRTRQGGYRTVGTSVALFGLVVISSALAMAWPQPLLVMLVAAAAGIFLTRIAFRESLAWAHAAAIPALALALVIGYHGIVGHWFLDTERQGLSRLFFPASHPLDTEGGVVLAAFALVLAMLSEFLVQRGSLAHSLAYALGAVACGLVGLVLVNVNGIEFPTRASAVSLALAAGLLAANLRWQKRALALGSLWLILTGTLWLLHSTFPENYSLWGFLLALESLAFAACSLVLRETPHRWVKQLQEASGNLAVVSVVVVYAILVASTKNIASGWNSAAFFTSAITALTLARVFAAPLPTYFASGFALLGVLHMNTLALAWHPLLRAFLVAFLVHATVGIAAAMVFRKQQRLLAVPLWIGSLVSAACAVVLIFFAPGARTLEWAGFAVWLGLIFLSYALVWRRYEAFAAFQLAFCVAALHCGAAWIEAWDQLPDRKHDLFSSMAAALRVNCAALGLLGLVWALARMSLQKFSLVRKIWLDRPWPVDRLALAVAVVVQIILAAGAIVPEVKAELTPASYARSLPRVLEIHLEPTRALAWMTIAILATSVLASWRLVTTSTEGRGQAVSTAHLLGLVCLFLTAPLIWAGAYAADRASATALRWGLALAFATGSGLLAARIPLRSVLDRLGFPPLAAPYLRATLLTILAAAAGVVVLISIRVAELGLLGLKLSGPVPGSAFAALGALTSNLVPLALVVLGLAGTALRERFPGYAFAGGAVFASTIAAGYALGVVTAGRLLGPAEEVHVWLLLSASAALWAIAWLALEFRIPGGMWLAIQSRLGFAGLILLTVNLLRVLLNQPQIQLAKSWHDFGIYGWAVLPLAAIAGMWQSRRSEPNLKLHVIALSAVLLSAMAAALVQPWDDEGKWLSFHVLSAAWAVVSIRLIVFARKTSAGLSWLDGMALALTILALDGGSSDPFRPWWPAGLAAIASLLLGARGILGPSPSRIPLSLVLSCLAATLLWFPTEMESASSFLLMNAAGLAVAGAVWSMLALRTTEAWWHYASDLARGLSLLFLGIGLASTLGGDRYDPRWLTWTSSSVVALGFLVAAWDPRAKLSRGGLFAVGALLVLLGVTEATASSIFVAWQTNLALAGYCTAVAGLAILVSRLKPGFLRLPVRGDSWDWLLAAEAALGAMVFLLGMQTALISPELSRRLSCPSAIFLLAITAMLLIRAVPERSLQLRYATATLGVMVVSTLAWAWPDPAGAAPWLERNAWLFVGLAACGILGSELAVRGVSDSWRSTLRTVGGITAAFSLAVLVIDQLQQVPLFNRETPHTPLEFAPVLAMLLAIVGLFALLIRFALNQERDPLALPERRRTLYVYLAELLIVLLFVHIKFNIPELFAGAMVRYWTFTVMALAFVGIGLAEYFEKRGLNVLALPLRRTGVLLPLIPLLAFWAKPPAALTEFASGSAPGLSPFLQYLDKLPQHFDTYAWLWSLAGLLYGLVALSRQSFGWALLAALAANAALWSMLTHEGVPFFVHPQAWVIPLALIVLASEHINRRRLRADLSNGLRYLGISMIYVASSADMFIAGVGSSLWLPVILAVICVAGVLLGIVLQVRAFLFLGVGFLFLDIFAMIWHAAVDLEQTWVWYVSGIILGVAILTLFAIFEKRKKRHAEG